MYCKELALNIPSFKSFLILAIDTFGSDGKTTTSITNEYTHISFTDCKNDILWLLSTIVAPK